jgi:hypothetical protein
MGALPQARDGGRASLVLQYCHKLSATCDQDFFSRQGLATAKRVKIDSFLHNERQRERIIFITHLAQDRHDDDQYVTKCGKVVKGVAYRKCVCVLCESTLSLTH